MNNSLISSLIGTKQSKSQEIASFPPMTKSRITLIFRMLEIKLFRRKKATLPPIVTEFLIINPERLGLFKKCAFSPKFTADTLISLKVPFKREQQSSLLEGCRA